MDIALEPAPIRTGAGELAVEEPPWTAMDPLAPSVLFPDEINREPEDRPAAEAMKTEPVAPSVLVPVRKFNEPPWPDSELPPAILTSPAEYPKGASPLLRLRVEPESPDEIPAEIEIAPPA